MRGPVPEPAPQPFDESTSIQWCDEVSPKTAPQTFVLRTGFRAHRFHHNTKTRHVWGLGLAPSIVRPCARRFTITRYVDPKDRAARVTAVEPSGDRVDRCDTARFGSTNGLPTPETSVRDELRDLLGDRTGGNLVRKTNENSTPIG